MKKKKSNIYIYVVKAKAKAAKPRMAVTIVQVLFGMVQTFNVGCSGVGNAGELSGESWLSSLPSLLLPLGAD